MKHILTLVLACILSGSTYARGSAIQFWVYSSPHATDTYHVYKRSESACMYDMDEARFGTRHDLHSMHIHYDRRFFHHCGWQYSYQHFVVQRNNGAVAILMWYKERLENPGVEIREDPHHLICRVLPSIGVCPPRVIIGDGIHCPYASPPRPDCS